LVERLVRNESAANLLTLSHVPTPLRLEGKLLNRAYLTLSHKPRKQGGEWTKQCNNARTRTRAIASQLSREPKLARWMPAIQRGRTHNSLNSWRGSRVRVKTADWRSDAFSCDAEINFQSLILFQFPLPGFVSIVFVDRDRLTAQNVPRFVSIPDAKISACTL
jgi:hypothetical protein